MREASWLGVGTVLIGCEAAPGVVVSAHEEEYGEVTAETTVELRSGRTLTLAGRWRERDSMWPDAALVFRSDVGVEVLEGGSRTSWALYRWPAREWRPHAPFEWSADGTTLYAWLDVTTKLAAFDVQTGMRRTILELPTSFCDLELRTECDPGVVRRPHTLFEHGDRLLVLLQELSNEDVVFWQRRDDRGGGHQLLAIPRDGDLDPQLGIERQWTGTAYSWEFSRRRGEIYLLVDEQRSGTDTMQLRARRLDGGLVDRLDAAVGGWRRALALSPDERWLLLERGSVQYFSDEPPVVEPRARTFSAGDRADVLAASRAGFVLLDLERGGGIEMLDRAYACTWTPDSTAITYLRHWELCRFDVDRRTWERLAYREPTSPHVEPIYFQPPVWSSNGVRMIVSIGESGYPDVDHHSLILDFDRREYVLLDAELENATWAPVPHPFKRPK